MKKNVLGLTWITLAAFLCFALPGLGQNIITFGDAANTCGGAVICSTDGTTGYLNNGTGQAFNLTTLSSWFQIDATGSNLLATQTEAEPDHGAGGFLVVNNTGTTVTTYSLTITDTFTSSTASVNFCSGSSGPLCDKFSANKPNGTYGGTSETLSGISFYQCTNGTSTGTTCSSSAGQAAALFSPNTVTYTWSGLDIPSGAKFNISFASWNNGSSPPTVSEGSSILMLAASGFVLLGAIVLKSKFAA